MISKDKQIDLIKIAKIKTKAQLKKYHKNTPLNNLGYLFHYLILTNNLTGLKLYKFPIHKTNIDGLNGLMLAAREKNYSILNYLISKYKNVENLKNKKNMNFVNYLYPQGKEYVELIKNNKLDWGKLFTNYDKNHISGLDILFMKGDYKTIIKTIKLLNKTNIDYSNYMSQPFHFKLLFNNKLDDDDIINILKLLEEHNKDILITMDDMGYNIAHAAILRTEDYEDNEGLKLLKYLVNKLGTELNKYTPISGTHIFVTAYKLGVKTNDFSKARYILEHVMNNHYDKSNFYETDNNGNNIVSNVLRFRTIFNKGDFNIEKILLKNYDAWSILNIYKKSPLMYIVNLDYDKYHKFVNNRPSNLEKILDKSSDKSINSKWLKYLKNLPIVEDALSGDNINLAEYQYAHSNLFQARFTDIGIFIYYLREKYKTSKTPLYIPIYKGDDVIPEWDDDMQLPDELLRFNNNYPWIIVWNNEKHYWIHPHLNELIKHSSKNNSKNNYKAACVFLSLRLPDGGLHAGVVFYNFETKIIERFDPYGNTTQIDGKLDSILGEKLTEGLGSDWKYCSPSCYFPVSGFQTLSDENNILNQKMGDFGGYCLAWSIWYVEHKLNNMNIEPKDLVRKTINRFMKMNIKIMEYIRNYANYISKFRFGYLKKLGIPENIVSNEHLNNHYLNLIKESI